MLKKFKTLIKLIINGKLLNWFNENIWYFNYYFHGRSYKYDYKKFETTFLKNNHIDSKNNTHKEVEEVIYCFWTGKNELTPNRAKSLEVLKEHVKVKLELITINNLDKYILDEAPLHPAYEYLSLVHKSDYLRCYFMHFHGGGYTDIKSNYKSWVKCFNQLNSKNDKWLLGYKEPNFEGVAVSKFASENLAKELENNWSIPIGNGAYISKSQTPFTFEWYNELHKRLDKFSPELKLNPGNTWGDNEDYPIKWSGILGDIFHPLCLKYNKHLIHNNDVIPVFKNYR